MASEPVPNLPLFYKDLMPLNSRDHGAWRSVPADRADWLMDQHAIPVTVDEFAQAQRNFPIVFSQGDNPVPLALMGLNEGVNTFVNADGQITEDIYLPAYIRRYPYLLARLDNSSEQMSLCFDPSSGLLKDTKEGDALFEGEEPTELVKNVLEFCRRFEEAGMRTSTFVQELKKHDLLTEGEVAIRRNDNPEAPPYVYRGFQIVNLEKFAELRGDVLRTWNQNGMLPLIHAHIFSLELLRVIFARQTNQGRGPGADMASTTVN